MNIQFSEIEISDTKQIAEIHFEELGDGVISLFGYEFVKRLYINLLEAGNWGFLAKDKNDVVGFIIATRVEVKLQKCLTISSVAFFILESIRRPSKFYSFLIAFREFFLLKEKAQIKPTNTFIELSHFAVRGHYKGGGIGRTLIQMLEERAREKGILSIFTRTHNKKLSEYYIRTKEAKILKSIPFKGHESIMLEWKI